MRINFASLKSIFVETFITIFIISVVQLYANILNKNKYLNVNIDAFLSPIKQMKIKLNLKVTYKLNVFILRMYYIQKKIGVHLALIIKTKSKIVSRN